MPLSKEAIREFKEIYKKEFGKKLSDQEALEKAINLLTLFRAIYRPIPKEHEKEFKKICREQDEYSEKMKKLAVEKLTEILVKQIEAKKKVYWRQYKKK